MPSFAQNVPTIPGSIAAPDTATNRFSLRGTGRTASADGVRATGSISSGQLLSPAPSGAGTTGFDSSNSKRRGKKAKTKTSSPARELVPLGPVTPSEPIGRRPQDKAGASFASAGAPGRPPVELGPIYTVPKRRKAYNGEDPYAPLGLRSGGLLFYPAVELIAGHNSNPSQSSSDGPGAMTYTVAPEVRVQSDWLRHEVKGELRGSYTDYRPDTTPTLSRPYFSGALDGRIDVTHNDRIDLGTRALVSTDNPGSPNLNADLSRLPLFTTVGGSAGYAHRFNRLEIGVKGDVERTAYQDSRFTDGTTASNRDRNYNQVSGTLRAGYEYFPGVTPFAEVTADTRRHDEVPDDSGFNRNSKGLTGKLGTTFQMTRFLTGEIAIGYTRRVYEDSRLANVSGLIGNASLIWNASALTTVKLTGSSTVGESTIADVSGIIYRDVGLQVDHAFRQWLIGTVKAGFGVDTYMGGTVVLGVPGATPLCDCVTSSTTANAPDRTDKRYSVGVGLTYKMDRSMQLKAEARRDWLRSNVTGADYTANIFLAGVRLQY